LTQKMESALNKQVERECSASFLYLAMSAWCSRKSLDGCSKFLRRQSEEEYMHMMRIFDYVEERDGAALVPGIESPKVDYNTVHEVFEDVFQHELAVTRSIHQLMELAEEEKDYATQNFLQWYVEEQREEEMMMRQINDKIKLIGDSPQSLYFIDKELEMLNNDSMKADPPA